MSNISDNAKQGSAPAVEDGLYFGTIVKAEVPKDPATGLAKENQYGKTQLAVTVRLDDIEDDAGSPIELRRAFAISYGKNQKTGQPSGLVQMIAVAMGLAVNDKGIRHVGTAELTGKRVYVQTITVERDGQTYVNIHAFLPLPRPNRTASARPTPTEPARTLPEALNRTREYSQAEEEADLQDLPF